MGLLSEGKPLTWEETQGYAEHVRQHGITQFINLYRKLKDMQTECLKWGDEVEYMIVNFDDEKKEARLSLRANDLLPKLQEEEYNNPDGVKSLWRPEYGAFMIEGTPGRPYGGLLSFFNIVEANMRLRRQEASALLNPGESVMSLTSFPRLGATDFCLPDYKPTPEDGPSRSHYLPNEAIYPGHPRFATLTRNIRMRRGEKVAIHVPILKDTKTPDPYVEDVPLGGKPDHIYMDAMGFGMGCCCLQVTFQTCNIQEARTLYDQLTPLCPVMLALTAASPFYRGKISDVDCRWNVISGAVDCRTREERGLEPLKKNKFLIPKSRYDSIDCYLSECGAKYNDVPVLYDESVYKRLQDADIDDQLAQHIAHLFIRDTVSLFGEKIHQDDEKDTDHFEVDENMQKAQKKNALHEELMWFKKDILTCVSPPAATSCCQLKVDHVDEYVPMSINHIINGKQGEFPGLIPLINSYLSGMDVDADTHCTIQQYLKLIQRRASGELLTTASYMRSFVDNHPLYQKDSNISNEVNYDLLKHLNQIQNGEIVAPKLLGLSIKSKTQESIPSAMGSSCCKEDTKEDN